MTESKPAPNEAAAAVRATRRTVAAGAAALALSALAIVRLLSARMSWPPAEALMLSRGTGWVALSFLLLSLSISPVARIARRAGVKLAGAGVVRRALGMTAAWCALAHALSALGGSLAWDFAALIGWPHLSAGLAALAILLLLLATSFTRVVVSLRLALWKELHRLAYAAALFVLAHLMLAPFAPRALTLALFAATFLLGLARFL